MLLKLPRLLGPTPAAPTPAALKPWPQTCLPQTLASPTPAALSFPHEYICPVGAVVLKDEVWPAAICVQQVESSVGLLRGLQGARHGQLVCIVYNDYVPPAAICVHQVKNVMA